MRKSIFTLVALAMIAMGCSTSEGNEPNTAPTPPPAATPTDTTVIEAGSDARPNWVAPNANYYEQNMQVYLTLQDKLQPYISENDMVCAKIDGEVRGVAVPRLDEGDWLISLFIFSNGAAPIQLSYYCDKLHRIFTTDWATFDAAVPPTGEGGIYLLKFVE